MVNFWKAELAGETWNAVARKGEGEEAGRV